MASLDQFVFTQEDISTTATALSELSDTVISNQNVNQTIAYQPTEFGALEQGWSYTGINSVAIVKDSQGFIYSADGNDVLVHKLDSSGGLVTSFNPGYDFNYNSLTTLAIDSQDNLYTAGNGDVGRNNIHKFDTNGNLLWTVDPASLATHIYIESSTFIEYLYITDAAGTVRKYDIDGNEITTQNWPVSVEANIAIPDQAGHIYIGAGQLSSDKNVVKYDLAGNQVWTFTNHTDNVTALAADTSGNVYSGGNDNIIYKIDSEGNQVWSFTNHSSNVTCLALDGVGYLYSGSSDNTVRMIDTSTGTEVSSFTSPQTTIQDIIYKQNYVYYSTSNVVSRLERTGVTAAAWINIPNTLDSHADVDAATPSTNSVLTWTGSSWTPQAPSTSTLTLDLSDDGSNESTDLQEIATTNDTNNIFTHPAADKLLIDVSVNWPQSNDTLAIGGNSVATSTAPTDGDVLTWNGTNSEWEPQASSGSGVSSSTGTSTDNAIARYDGTGGSTIQQTGVVVDDNDNISGHGQSISFETADFTLAASQAGQVLDCDSGSAFTVTVPTNANVALPVGFTVQLVQSGTNTVSVTGQSGVTIQTPSTTDLNGQWSSATLYKRQTDEWVLIGDLA